MGVIFRNAPEAFEVLRGVGAISLCWLGVRALWRARKGSTAPARPDVERIPAFRQGYTVTLLNPSLATFYFAVVPGFLTSPATLTQFAPLAAIHISLALVSHLAWVMAAGAFRTRLAAPPLTRAIDVVGGLALLLLGAKMLL